MKLRRYVELFGEVRKIKKQFKILDYRNAIERKKAYLLRLRLQGIYAEVQKYKPRLRIVEF